MITSSQGYVQTLQDAAFPYSVLDISRTHSAVARFSIMSKNAIYMKSIRRTSKR